MSTATRFASMDDYARGGVEIIGADAAPRYLFSNMFEVASKSRPWERVVVAKNLEFTIECARRRRFALVHLRPRRNLPGDAGRA